MWPAPVSGVIPGYKARVLDADTGRLLTGVKGLSLRADADGGLVTVTLTAYVDEDGQHAGAGDRVAIRRDNGHAGPLTGEVTCIVRVAGE